MHYSTQHLKCVIQNVQFPYLQWYNGGKESISACHIVHNALALLGPEIQELLWGHLFCSYPEGKIE